MNYKNLLLGTLAGGLADYAGGWLFYTVIFPKQFPGPAHADPLWVLPAALCLGLLLSFMLLRFQKLNGLRDALPTGLATGLILAARDLFFSMSAHSETPLEVMLLEAGIYTFLGGITALAAAFAMQKGG